MRIKIESDGTPAGTRILAGDRELTGILQPMRIVWELDANAEHARVQIHRLGGSRVDLDQVALEAEAESE